MLSDRQVAEDALQTVWLQVVRSLSCLREPERLSAWLYRIARFVIADQLRMHYNKPLIEPSGEISDCDDSETLIVLDSMEAGLNDLHPVDREAVILHYLAGLSLAEVAEVCEIPVGTVKSRLHRARQNLYDTLSK